MMKNGLKELSTSLQQSEKLDYNEAWSMPKSHCTDEDVLALERQHLFAKEWIWVGRVEEVPKPGGYMAFQLCNEPIVVVRGEDNKIRAMSNVCRHRGALLVEGRGNNKRLVCPNHHWSYDLEGKLAGAPRMEAHKAFDKSTCHSPQFTAEEWYGFLFVCLAENPQPLTPRLAPLAKLIHNYHVEQMKMLCDWLHSIRCHVPIAQLPRQHRTEFKEKA